MCVFKNYYIIYIYNIELIFYCNRPTQESLAREAGNIDYTWAILIMPPQTGSLQLVVVGNEVNFSYSTRAARKAKHSASTKSPRQPRESTSKISLLHSSSCKYCIMVALCLPPPQISHRCGISSASKNWLDNAMQHAVNFC